jgi:hypothetical protein
MKGYATKLIFGLSYCWKFIYKTISALLNKPTIIKLT